MWGDLARLIFCCLFVAACITISECNAQIKITLRNLETIETPTLRFEQDWLELPDERILGWDQVLTVDGLPKSDKQKFEHFVTEQGLPLYRLKHRLQIGDWSSLEQLSEYWFKKIATRIPNQKSVRQHLIVNAALFRSRLFNGKRTEALAAFFHLCELESKFPDQTKEIVRDAVPLESLKSNFSNSLIPVWFDKAAVNNFLADRKIDEDKISQNSDGKLIYLASMSSCDGKNDQAKLYLEELSGRESALAKQWHPILSAQHELNSRRPGNSLAVLRKKYRQLNGPPRAVANYLIAKRDAEHQDGIDSALLDLLYIPANYSSSLTSLSAAALDMAAKIAEADGNVDEANIFRLELSDRFPNTYHGRKFEKK